MFFGPITNVSTNPTPGQVYLPTREKTARAAILHFEGVFDGATLTPQIQRNGGSVLVPDTDGQATAACRRVLYLVPGETVVIDRSGAGANTSVTVTVF